MESKRLACALCVIVAALMVVPAGVLAGGQGGKAPAAKEWTLMMYWDADNSLEFCTEFAMTTWEAALTSNEKVNIIAFVDILSADGTWVYEISGGARKVVATWPELNSSDPATLEKFVLFTEAKYPAKKTMLVLQDHGYGWRGICQDETNGDVLLSPHMIAKALADVEAKGKRVDIVACDACNMASAEVAYELRNVASIYLASQSMVPFDGLPYKMMIERLLNNPAISPRDFASSVVYDYVEYYSEKWDYAHIMRYSQDFATMSAWDLSKMPAFGSSFAEMTHALLPLIAENRKAVDGARGFALQGTWTNMAGYEWMPDMYAFFDGVKALDASLGDAVLEWEMAFDAALIAEAHSRKYDNTGVNGLNIWFPPSMSQYNMQGWTWARQFSYTDSGLDLVAESSWNACLMEYYASG